MTLLNATLETEATQISSYCEHIAQSAKEASALLGTLDAESKNRWLLTLAEDLIRQTETILSANAADLASAAKLELSAAAIDRLRLTPERIQDLATGVRNVAALPDPVGRLLEERKRPNGLKISKVAVPLGVILFIYESRPNVTVDAAALCVKSGNAIILRGGREAYHTNAALVEIMQHCLAAAGITPDAVQLVDRPEHEAVGCLLKLDRYIDLVIPRGGETLIRRVAAEARMPVLKHYKGNCHVYVDRAADLAMAEKIVVNAKCQRPAVCNAAESLLVHREIADHFVPRVAAALRKQGVEIRGCAATCALLDDVVPATEADYWAEYLDLVIAVRIVDDVRAAIAHINHYGSQHTDAIVTNDAATAQQFTSQVDSSAVMVNASTRFNDGFEFGMGAEIGISTDKFHARGPCALLELTSYKYIVYGDGQVREG
jgi:glutamate-5-semialdehyde dehydrogenase